MSILTHEAPSVKAIARRCHACHAPLAADGLCGACEAEAAWGMAPEVEDAPHPADAAFWAEHAADDDDDFGRAVEEALGYSAEDHPDFADEWARAMWRQADAGEALTGHDFA